MSAQEAARSFTEANDSDVLAVRNLMDSAGDTNDCAATDETVVEQAPEVTHAKSHQSTETEAPDPRAAQPSYTSRLLRSGALWAMHRIKTYRPDRRAILLTSAVLLLILKPFMVIGWTLFAGFVVLLCYLFMGGERFWRAIIAIFQKFKRRRPAAARVLKLRSYVIARKWNGLMQWAPQGICDFFQVPDLREIIAADTRHEAAMSDRLRRMGGDAAAG